MKTDIIPHLPVVRQHSTHQRILNLIPNIQEVLLSQEGAVGPLLCLLVVPSWAALSLSLLPLQPGPIFSQHSFGPQTTLTSSSSTPVRKGEAFGHSHEKCRLLVQPLNSDTIINLHIDLYLPDFCWDKHGHDWEPTVGFSTRRGGNGDFPCPSPFTQPLSSHTSSHTYLKIDLTVSQGNFY